MKAFVAGASGETGQRIVRQLVGRGIAVKGLVRDAVGARPQLPIEAELFQGDLSDRESLQRAMKDCTVVMHAAGARPSVDLTGPYKVDCQGTNNLVDAAKTNNIEHFVMVSSLCVSRLFHPLNLFGLVLWWKRQGEMYLQKSGLNYTIVRPGGLRNEDADPRKLVMEPADTLFEGGVSRWKVAETCIEALFQPNARNCVVEIVAQEQAPDQSFAELFANAAKASAQL